MSHELQGNIYCKTLNFHEHLIFGQIREGEVSGLECLIRVLDFMSECISDQESEYLIIHELRGNIYFTTQYTSHVTGHDG